MLSNDFETFHAERARPYWERKGLRVESLYGLLCAFGRRERKESSKGEPEGRASAEDPGPR